MVLEFLSDTAIRKFTTVLTGKTVRPTFSGQTFFKEITANTTFSFATTGLSAEPAELFDFRIILRLVGGTVLFPDTWIWAGGEEPTVNAAGYYTIHVCTPDGGENWLAALERTYVTPSNWKFVTSLLDNNSGGTLREVIAAAQTGDVVKFGRGVTGTIVLTQGALLLNKRITLDGGNKITISGNSATRIIRATVDGCVVENIVLNNGYVTGSGPAGCGAGVYAEAAITLESVTIENCSATSGAAVYSEDTLTLNNCVIQTNTATNGAGIMIDSNATVTLSGCQVKWNAATTNGGGLYKVGTVTHPTVVIKDCTFQTNSAATGGALYLQQALDLDVSDTTFSGNSATTRAPVAYLNGYTSQTGSKFKRCLFSGNTGNATTDGLVYATTIPNGLITDSVFTGNTFTATTGYHRCVYCTTSATAFTLRNCTFTDNDKGGGFYVAAGTLNVHNCVDALNTHVSASGASATLNVSKSLSDRGTWADIAYSSGQPLFDVDHYTPVAGSQVINKGDNTKTDSLVDFNGKSRIVNTTIDLGAVEYQG